MAPAEARSSARSPTGQQWRIGHGRQEVIVTEVGATLRSFTLDGAPVMDGFGPDEWSHSGRGQVLAPWPNRLGDGRYVFGGVTSQAPLNEPATGNAIHGLVRWLPFAVEARAQNVVVLVCTVYPSPAYPYLVELRIEYRIGPGRPGCHLDGHQRRLGHAALRPGLPPVPDRRDRPRRHGGPAAAGQDRSVLDARGLPTGEVRPVAGTELDFTAPRAIGPTRIDVAYTALSRDGQGLAWASLEDPSSVAGPRPVGRRPVLLAHVLHRRHPPRSGPAPESGGYRAHELSPRRSALGPGPGRPRARAVLDGRLGAATSMISAPGSPAGHVAVVTGSASGIGQAVARAFAARGAAVLVNSARSVEAGQALADELPDAAYVQADISVEADTARLVAVALERWGRIDTLVNNAGTTMVIDHRDLEAAHLGVWRDIFSVNVFGTWAMTVAAVPALRRSGGSVVNIGSTSALTPTGSSVPYAASKAAVHHMTVLLAKALGPEIRVNTVAPGLTDTPWTADWDAKPPRSARWPRSGGAGGLKRWRTWC